MNYKILMVDDDRELLKMLNQYFTLKNYTVIIAENGIEAMEKISANPDIILLDVNMPGMDGIEVCRRIRDMVSCPIIFLTAKVEEQDRVMGLLSGGDDYVLKPFSLKELDARIIAHLKREERLHRKKEQRFYGELVMFTTCFLTAVIFQKIIKFFFGPDIFSVLDFCFQSVRQAA